MPDDPSTEILIPDLFPSETSIQDSRSRSEQDNLFAEKIKVLHWIYIYGIRFAFFTICIVFAIRIFHFITPYRWQWLCEHQLQVLDKFLFSGVIGAFVGKNFDKAFKGMTSSN